MLDKKNFYIDGKWVAPKNLKEIQVIDPATEKNCADTEPEALSNTKNIKAGDNENNRIKSSRVQGNIMV